MEEFIVKIPEQYPMTDDELFALCIANKELRIERNELGQLIIMSPTGGITGNLNFRLTTIFGKWVDENSTLGYGFDSASGFRLRDKSMRSPDVAWIKKDRWESLPIEDREKFPSICPDFVIELRSKSDSLSQLKSKMNSWIKNGVQLAWLIDPTEEKVFVYTQSETIEIIGFDKSIMGGTLLPGFELQLSKLK
jgi:Uma2 family endonuclease